MTCCIQKYFAIYFSKQLSVYYSIIYSKKRSQCFEPRIHWDIDYLSRQSPCAKKSQQDYTEQINILLCLTTQRRKLFNLLPSNAFSKSHENAKVFLDIIISQYCSRVEFQHFHVTCKIQLWTHKDKKKCASVSLR